MGPSGASVRLAAFTREHAERTFSWVNEPKLMLSMNFPGPVDRDQHWQWFERIQKQHVFAIEEDGVHVGNCCLKNHDPLAARCELWIYIGGPENRGRGTGGRALGLLLEYGFTRLDLNRIFLYYVDVPGNPGRFYRRAGFREEGRLRRHLFIQGKARDAVYMGLMRDEWKTHAETQ